MSTRGGEWGTFFADILFIWIVKSILARSTPILSIMRLCSCHACHAGEGVTISYRSLWAFLAIFRTAFVSSFNSDSLDGNLGFGLSVVII